MSMSTFNSLNGLNGGKVRRGQVVKVQKNKRVRVAKDDADELMAQRSEGEPEHGSQAEPDDDDEDEQIDEVKKVERAAAESRRRGPQPVHIESPKPQPKAEKPRQETRQDSRQWQKRNERYADKRGRKTRHSQEDTYKNSRSSSKRGDSAKRGRHARAEKPAPTTDYNIKKGESLSEIAEKTGTTVDALRKANGISGDKIKAGDNIKIPGKGGKASGKKQAASKASGKSSKASSKAGKSSSKSTGKKRRR
ncbi:MAG: LysM peptidoglycan-binding domain-containing protein [Muribaculaceae bacterium]|nr:LysM peptidoglycan-binding domain-containing protein [Muribaculaceae bacterium]